MESSKVACSVEAVRSVAAAGRQSSLGSGFLVGDGLALTNYHVVSQYALEPKNYRLEYTMADGGRGDVTLLAVGVEPARELVRAGLPACGDAAGGAGHWTSAAADGVVQSVSVKPGDQVAIRQTLVTLGSSS